MGETRLRSQRGRCRGQSVGEAEAGSYEDWISIGRAVDVVKVAAGCSLQMYSGIH